MIRCSGLVKTFGPARALDGLELEVARGEVHGFLGPNGAGKSVTMRVLLGLLPLSDGEVRVAGRSPRRGSPEIGYVPQQQPLDPDLPLRGRDLVGLGLDGHRFGLGLRGRAERRRTRTPWPTCSTSR